MDLNEKAYNELIGAFQNMQEDHKRWLKEREEKVWSNPVTSYNLRNLLSNFTKDELSAIRQNLGLRGISALKKQELLDILETAVIGHSRTLFQMFDDFRYELVKKIVDNKGVLVKANVAMDDIEYFRTRGMIFPGSLNGKRALVMPEEIIAELKKIDDSELRRLVKRNTHWIRLTQGLLFYYGTLDLEKLIEMIERLTKAEITNLLEFCSILNDASEYYEEIYIDINGLSHYRVMDSEKVRQEHDQRPNLEFFPFTYEQVYKAGVPDFVDKNLAFSRFSKFLTDNYTLDSKEADEVVEECVYAVRIDEPLGDIIEFLQQQFEIDSLELLNEFTEQVVFLMNNTRQWFLKGFTPHEVHSKDKTSVIPFRVKSNDPSKGKSEQIGRNDLCPCGSGRKYKKCCGR